MKPSAIVIVALMLVACLGGQAAATGRFALVIGNTSYQPGYELKNPIADARGIAQSLAGVGFQVVTLEDSDLGSVQRAVDAFSAKALKGDIAVIYYAGHGARIDNRDFLLPIDFSMASFDKVDTEAFDVDRLVQALAATRSRLKLLLFDACRNNPLESRGAQPLRAPEASPQYGANTLTVFATAQGMTALDGLGNHSPFAEAMMLNLGKPEIELSELIKSVTAHVRDRTAGRQTTYQQGSLDESFFLARYDGPPGTVSAFATAPLAVVAGLVFANSGSEPLGDADLAGKDAATLRLARNEIFARHNRRFADPALAAHFAKFDWYQPDAGETALSAVERGNVELIRRYELSAGLPSDNFIFPDSDRRLLTPDDVASLSKSDLRIARNEIYARRGWDFKTPEMEAYFETFDWYEPKLGKVELSHIEQKNVDFIAKWEK